MTLANCERLLKHYNDLVDGTIPKPVGHKDWADVVANAKVRAKAMEERIAHKKTLPMYANVAPVFKPVEKKDGKKSKG